MKITKKHAGWLVGILLLQLAAYQYFNKILLAPTSQFSQQEISIDNGTRTDYSPDGEHYAKIAKNSISIYADGGKLLQEYQPAGKDEVLSYNGWIPAMKFALVAAAADSSSATQITVHALSLGWLHSEKEYVLQGLPKGSRVIDTAFFSNDRSLIALVKNSSGKQVYQVREKEKAVPINLKTTNIRRIASLEKQSVLLFDRPGTGKVYYRDESGSIKDLYPKSGTYVLLGIDKDDQIYIARMSDDTRCDRILRGTLQEGLAEYKVLSSPYPVEAIRLNYDGSIIYY